MSRYKTREIDLATARTDPGDFFTVTTTRKYLMVASAPDTAYLHSGTEDSDRVGPLERGDSDCAPEEATGSYSWSIENPGGSGTLVLVLTDDPSLCLADVGAGGAPASISSSRLSSPLGPGDSIASGERLSVEVGTAGAEQARARAQVSGLTGYSKATLYAPAALGDANGFAVDEGGARGWIADGDDGEIREVDLTDPDAPVANGQVIPTGWTSAYDVAYDADADLVLAFGDDGTNQHVAVLDVSSRGNPSESGQVQVASPGSLPADRFGAIAASIRIDTAQSVAVVTETLGTGSQDIRGLRTVDYSTPATPAMGTTYNAGMNQGAQAFRVDSDRARVYSYYENTDGAAEFAIFRLAGTNLVRMNVYTISGANENPSGEFRLPYDPDRQLAWLYHPGNDRTHLVDVAGDAIGVESTDVLANTSNLSNSSWRGFVGLYEPSTQTIYGENNNDLVILDASDPDDLGDIIATSDLYGELVYYADANVLFAAEANDGLQPLVEDPGDVRLRIYSLDPSGNRNPAPIAEDTGTNLSRLLATLDLVGEGAVDVEVLNRGENQGTVEFVDFYQEAS